MSFIDKIKIENTDYDIQDTEARKQINECLKTESDPTVPTHVKAITEQNINDWNNKSNFSGNYNDLTSIPSEFNPSTHTHKMSDITDYQEPDLSDYALKSEIPTNYITEIPAEYITEEELDKALENIPSGSAIPEIKEDVNVFDLETGIYYVDPGVTLTYASFPMGEEGAMNTSVTIQSKIVLTIGKSLDEEEGFGALNYTAIGCPAGATAGGMLIYGDAIGMFDGNEYMWIAPDPMVFDSGLITTLHDIKREITAESQNDLSIATSGAIYLFVTTEINKAIGTALDGEY